MFLIEKNVRMRLAAQRQASEGFHRVHQQMQVGDCLCGRAAQGEVIITRNCNGDRRHTLPYIHAEPHGHLILPLKAKDKTVGVFYYYLPPNYEVEPPMLDTLTAITSQLGLAIENARLYAKVLELTTQDALTGLGNRRYLDQILERDLSNVERYNATLSLVMLYIDYFKLYNDTHGHLEGDRLLTKVAKVLRDVVRTGDSPVRYGGEEFIVLLPHTGLRSAGLAAERIRRAMEQSTPITVSLGGSSVSGKKCSAEVLIALADEALYRAKQGGRNRVELSTHAL